MNLAAPEPAPAPALPAWPYPRWIAHRGAGKLAPENTLAAFRLGAGYGYRMFECDAKLSADGIPFLLHDAELTRTTNALQRLHASGGAGEASDVGGDHDWQQLSQLDAGSWHSPAYAGEPLPTLEALARFCLANGYLLNIEIKPTPGTGWHTGEVVAQHAARLWRGQAVPPLLTSFDSSALQAAAQAQPQLPRGLLLDDLEGKAFAHWLAQAHQLQCAALVLNHLLWDKTTVSQTHAAGLRTLCYTVNQASQAKRLLALGVDGIITDRVDSFQAGGEE
ncbi:MAG: glycerophosphodiester phosphodiesterase [Rhodoferax sp.]|nr:glycerophosphodiester phosphodiesterase [Rhodoferax sp.]